MTEKTMYFPHDKDEPGDPTPFAEIVQSMVFDNWAHYTREETLDVLSNSEDIRVMKSPSEVTNHIFDSQNITDATGVMLGAHINVIVLMSHMRRVFIAEENIGSLNFSHLTPVVVDRIGGICCDSTQSYFSATEFIFIIIALVSHGADFDDVTTWLQNVPHSETFFLSKEISYWMNPKSTTHSSYVSALIDHMGHSRLSYMGNTLAPSNFAVGEYLTEVFSSTPTPEDARALCDRLLAIVADDTYNMVFVSNILTNRRFVGTLPHDIENRGLVYLNKALDGYNSFSHQHSDHMAHTNNAFTARQYTQCLEKYRTYLAHGHTFAADVAMFYILSVPARHRTMVLGDLDYIMDRFVDIEKSLSYRMFRNVMFTENGSMMERGDDTNPSVPTCPTFSPAMMSVVCDKAEGDVFTWCDMVLMLAYCSVVSFHQASTVTFVVENFEHLRELPVEWVAEMTTEHQ